MRSRWMVSFVLPLAGCGVVAGTIGCDLRVDSAANGYEDRCQERTGVQGNALFGGFCDVLGGDPIDGGCPDDGKVAGCDISEAGVGGSVIDWYYEPMTRDEVEGECAEEGTIIEP